jgi:predicted xylose isomerase-like sugar epimerase
MHLTPTADLLPDTREVVAEPGRKNLLFRADLTEAGFAAAVKAAQQALATGARLILLHSLAPVTDDGNTDPVPERQAQEQLDTLAGMLHQLFGLSITRLLTPYLTEAGLQSLTRQLNAEVVIRTAAPASR